MAKRKKTRKTPAHGRKTIQPSAEARRLRNKNKKLGFPYAPGKVGTAYLNLVLEKLESDLKKSLKKKVSPEKLQKIITAAEIKKMHLFNEYIENSIKIITLTEKDAAKKRSAVLNLHALQEKVKDAIKWKLIEAKGVIF